MICVANIQWHCANVEYSTATDINNLSVRNWAVDDAHAFGGEHCLLKQGYESVAQSMSKVLDVRLGCEVPFQIHTICSTFWCSVFLYAHFESEFTGRQGRSCSKRRGALQVRYRVVHILCKCQIDPFCRVHLADGAFLQSDLVLITLPLGVLKSKRVIFNPPFPRLQASS